MERPRRIGPLVRDAHFAAAARKLGEMGFGFMLDGQGVVIAHPNQELVMQKNFITADDANEETKAMAQNMNTVSMGSLMAVRKRTMDRAPTMPKLSFTLLAINMMTVAVTAMSVSPPGFSASSRSRMQRT